jgi:hypothetical protein
MGAILPDPALETLSVLPRPPKPATTGATTGDDTFAEANKSGGREVGTVVSAPDIKLWIKCIAIVNSPISNAPRLCVSARFLPVSTSLGEGSPYLSESLVRETCTQKDCPCLFTVKEAIPCPRISKHIPISFAFPGSQRGHSILWRCGGSRLTWRWCRSHRGSRTRNSLKARKWRTSSNVSTEPW